MWSNTYGQHIFTSPDDQDVLCTHYNPGVDKALYALYHTDESRNAGQAETHYQQALALAEELCMRPLQAHCHLGLGTLYAKIGQQEQARAAMFAAIVLYRAMDMTFWLPQAGAMLAWVKD